MGYRDQFGIVINVDILGPDNTYDQSMVIHMLIIENTYDWILITNTLGFTNQHA